MKQKICGVLIIVLGTSMLLMGCQPVNQFTAFLNGEKTISCYSEEVTDDVERNDIAPIVISEEQEDENQALISFATDVFKTSYSEEENTLLSPISILYALGMTANGAGGETLDQMETVFGLNMTDLNEYLYAYRCGIDYMADQSDIQFNLANSIWFKADDCLEVNPEFLQMNKDYYDAAVYETSFDERTLTDINNWTNNQTDGMIEEILDEIPENAVMYLVNALAFDAKWEEIYMETCVGDGIFTTIDGEEQTVEYMYSTEGTYIEGEDETGFMKMYEGGNFAFVALLPNEDISITEYIAQLDGAELKELLEDSQNQSVITAIPKFTSEYSANLREVMQALGMTDCFDYTVADFHNLAIYDDPEILEMENICISRILHKTYIAVDEQGTKAGAATAVEMTTESAAIEMKEVRLDRPFVYMIIDMEEHVPIFIGSMLVI